MPISGIFNSYLSALSKEMIKGCWPNTSIHFFPTTRLVIQMPAVKHAFRITIAEPDKELAHSLLSLWEGAELVDCSRSVQEISGDITKSSCEAVMINAEGTFGTDNPARPGCNGLELAMYLRVKYKITCPVILYGFLSSGHILSKDPSHIIIHAPGNAYIQFPFSNTDVEAEVEKLQSTAVLNGQTGEDAYKQLYIPYLKPGFNIDTFQHGEANWWSLKCMWDVHTAFSQDLSAKDTPYPGVVADNLNSITGAVGNFMYGRTSGDYQTFLSRDQALHDKYTTINKSKTEAINSRKLKILHIDNLAQKGWSDIIQKAVYYGAAAHPTKKGALTRRKFARGMYAYIDFGEFSTTEQLCTYLEGEIIDGKEKKGVFDLEEWDLIILDLLLFPETENAASTNFDDVSGVTVLDTFRHNCKEIPVIVTSASNKIWNYEKLQKLGADAYWIKECINSNFNIQESVLNYNKFICLIEKLSGTEYKLYKSMAKAVKNINLNQSLWWKRKIDWGAIGDTHNMVINKIDISTNPKVHHIKEILQNALLMLHGHLILNVLENSYNPYNDVPWHFPSLLIQHLGKIVEIVHGFDDHENTHKEKRNSGVVFGFHGDENFKITRGDLKGGKLYTTRNQASHYSKSQELGFEDAERYFVSIIDYLQHPPVSVLKCKQ